MSTLAEIQSAIAIIRKHASGTVGSIEEFVRSTADQTRTNLTTVTVQATPSNLAVRDRLREVQADQILLRNGAMTAETMARRNGLET